MNGRATWVELSTPDPEEARRFYGALLGWDVATTITPMGEYHVASLSGREVAGLMEQPPPMKGAPPRWTVYFLAEALEETIRRISGAGGKVVQPPFDVPGGARVAIATDSSGAMFALISGGPEPGPFLSMEPGAAGWVELMTSDPRGARRFYADVFGWDAQDGDAGGVTYTTFALGERQVAGMIPRTESVPPDVPDTWSVYFNVADCEASQKAAVELGGSTIVPATPTPMGPFAVLADPQGAVFQIMQFAEAT